MVRVDGEGCGGSSAEVEEMVVETLQRRLQAHLGLGMSALARGDAEELQARVGARARSAGAAANAAERRQATDAFVLLCALSPLP